MSNSSTYKWARFSRLTARILGLIFGISIVIFALLSGAEAYGNDFMAILKNSPNALPWLFFLLLICLAWKNEFLGGTIITVLGIAMLFFFQIIGNFMISTFVIVLMVLLIGNLFLLSWWLRK